MNEKSIEAKIEEWLLHEGYPLEYRVAKSLRSHGFQSEQGHHARRRTMDSSPREVDVLASLSGKVGDHLFRIVQVVECKYSVEKPWVFFTSPVHRMRASAIAAQTIASDYGLATMWHLAGEKSIQSLDLFASPNEPGFGGRQAFSKGQDLLYNSLQAVSGNCIAEAELYNPKGVLRPRYKSIPESCVVVFPLLVIEGRLFETGMDDENGQQFVREVGHTRCHWMGADDRSFATTVDVVTMSSLDDFAASRARDCKKLLAAMTKTHDRFVEFATTKDIGALKSKKSPRGLRGLPRLVRDLQMTR